MYIHLLNQWLMIKVISPKYYNYKIFLILLSFIGQIVPPIVNSHSSFYKYFNKVFFFFFFSDRNAISFQQSDRWSQDVEQLRKESDSNGRHLTLTRIKVTISSCHLLYLKRPFANTAFSNKIVPNFSK